MNNYEISLELERRRREHEKQRLRRIERLEQISPEYSDLRAHRNELLAEAALLQLTDNNQEALKKEEQAQSLTLKEKQILKNLGYPEDYLEVKYDCQKCKDVGYTEDGTVCDCLKSMIRSEKFNRFDLNEKTKSDTFDRFDFSLFSDKPNAIGLIPRSIAQINLIEARRFCDEIDHNPISMLYQGEPGTGKTFLVSCIANELINSDHDVVYLSAPNLINLLYDDIREKKTTTQSFKYLIKNAEIVIIDDLGTETDNDFTRNSISEIIDERLVSNKPTIITTNYEDLFVRYPGRMASRIFGKYKIFKFIGTDLRLKI